MIPAHPGHTRPTTHTAEPTTHTSKPTTHTARTTTPATEPAAPTTHATAPERAAPTPDPGRPDASAPSFGALLAGLRQARGWSQQKLAEELCVVSGRCTVTRHEVSRWERGLRLPGRYWLGQLARVLDCPVERLTEALPVAAAKPDPRPAAEFAAARSALLTLAHRWLADPADPLTGAPEPSGPPPPVPPADPPDRAGLAELRRLDDLVGGLDLYPARADRLAVPPVPPVTALPVGPPRRRVLALAAEHGQLAGWVTGDAGEYAVALGAYRRALIAAAGAGDRALGGHILGSAAHLLLGAGDAAGALLLARTGYAGARQAAPAGLRALLLHRVAFAAARAGQRQVARTALDAAARAADRREPEREPPWLYWLDAAEFAALTGRCLGALRRPLRAVPLLVPALVPTAGHRRAGIYGAWLARCYLDMGELEEACRVAEEALLAVLRSGSARAAGELAAVRRRLAPFADEPVVRRHVELVASVGPYLPALPESVAGSQNPGGVPTGGRGDRGLHR